MTCNVHGRCGAWARSPPANQLWYLGQPCPGADYPSVERNLQRRAAPLPPSPHELRPRQRARTGQAPRHQRSKHLPPHLPGGLPGLGRAGRRRPLLLGLRSRRVLPGARTASLPRRGPGPRHRLHRLHHLLRLLPDHRALPLRRRRLRGGSKLLGARFGVVSGSALLVDYVLTITVSIAAGADAIFSFLPPQWQRSSSPWSSRRILLLTILNLRGVKESVTALVPIFVLFLVTHAILIGGVVLTRGTELPAVAREVHERLPHELATLGFVGLAALFLRAYSMGAGTYTGIEAVSNGLQIMREPKVQTGKRTMAYMAISLALTAGGIILCYLLVHADARGGQDHERGPGRALRLRSWAGTGKLFVWLTLARETALLLVACAGRLHRRPAGHVQHGQRLLAPRSLRPALRAALHAQRASCSSRAPRSPPSSTPAGTRAPSCSCTPSTSSSPSPSPRWAWSATGSASGPSTRTGTSTSSSTSSASPSASPS